MDHVFHGRFHSIFIIISWQIFNITLSLYESTKEDEAILLTHAHSGRSTPASSPTSYMYCQPYTDVWPEGSYSGHRTADSQTQTPMARTIERLPKGVYHNILTKEACINFPKDAIYKCERLPNTTIYTYQIFVKHCYCTNLIFCKLIDMIFLSSTFFLAH